MDERMSDVGLNEEPPYDFDKGMTDAEPLPALSVIDNYEEIAQKDMKPVEDEVIDLKAFHWEITDWKNLPDRVQGPVFEAGGHKWNILLFPKGNNQNELLSVYLEYAELKENPNPDVYACAQFIILISPPSDPTRFVSQVSHRRFCSDETDWGFTKFMELHRLYQPDPQTGAGPFIEDESIRISVIVRVVNDSTGVLWHNFSNYDSKKVTGYVGLKNQGATCYMNSLFQSLYCTNYFRKAVYQIPTVNDNPSGSIALALQRLFYNLQFTSNSVNTTELTNSFGWNSLEAFSQHDVQEFNRILQDALEAKMKDTPADGAIKKLFLGKMKSYIKCINVDYESSRVEDYYDIQLNVKGCKNLEESFKDYVAEETLEGDNKYMAEGHGLQDAKKGVVFESFPPVLHLQLKRFEYDMMRDIMVKINDRHEFPLEIDLEPFLSENADKSQPHKYALHGVLVHTGDMTSGHYFAFVKPTKDGKWLRFDDERVTPATLKEVLEENYGGESLSTLGMNGRHLPRTFKRFTNAYMLVYIRESMRDEILSDIKKSDIPEHLIQRFDEERIAREKRTRERAEQHLYTRVVLATDESFKANTGFDFVGLDSGPRVEDTHVQTLRVRKNQPYREFLQDLAESTGVPLGHFRLWLLVNRQNLTIRPDHPLPDTPEILDLKMEKIQEKFVTVGTQHALRLYMETTSTFEDGLPVFPPPPNSNNPTEVLVFIKLFKPETQSLQGIGHLYVSCRAKAGSIMEDLNKMAGFEPGTPLRLYEEIKPAMIDPISPGATFEEAEIQDGDIICVQKRLSDEKTLALTKNGLYPTVREYMDFLLNKIHLSFVPKVKSSDGEVVLDLHKNTKYDEMAIQVALEIDADPGKIQFFLPGPNDESMEAITRDPDMTLESIFYSRYVRNLVNVKLYYEVLDISLDELETKRQVNVTVCVPTFRDCQAFKLWMPKQARISDLLKELQIDPKLNVRAFEAINCRYLREFLSTDALTQLNDSPAAQLYVEPIPDEDRSAGEEDFFIRVFHYQNNQHRTHSVPFKFLIRKDEPFSETKKRLQARTGIPDKEWSKVKFSIVSQYSAAPIDEDDFKLSDHQFHREDSLGLDHIDRNKTQKSGLEKGLFIRG